MGTSDLGAAKKARNRLLAEYDETWDALRLGAPSPTTVPYKPHILDAQMFIADFAYERQRRHLANEREQHRDDNEQQWAAFIAKEKGRLSTLSKRIATNNLSGFDVVLENLIRLQCWQIEKLNGDGSLSDEYLGFRRMLAEALLDARREQVEILEHHPSPQPRSQVVINATAATLRAAKPGESLEALFESYAKEKLAEGSKKLDTINQDRKVIQQFARHVGKGRSAASIDKADVREFRELISVLPVKWTSRSDYAGLTLGQAAMKARNDGTPARSLVTVSKELSAISAFFKWLVKKGYSQSNPTIGLFPEIQKRKRSRLSRRPSFRIDQLKEIFSSPLFVGCSPSPGKEHQPGEDLISDWRYWLPLCALFTGARLGELAQLHTNDIECLHEVWIVNVVDDDEEKSLKTEASYRFIPLHPKLIELGFLGFVERAKRQGHKRLFPEITPNERGHFGAKPSRFWRTYLKRIGIKKAGEERDGFGSHSFRHGFADECRSRGHMDAMIGVILGHSKGSTTSGYGVKTQGTVKMRADIINSLKFEGLNLDHLLPGQRGAK